MSLDHALKHLFPIELGGAHQADLDHDARILRAAQSRAEELLSEMFAHTAFALLVDWERVLGLPIAGDEPLQARRDSAVRKIRERGGLSRPYFVEVAAAMGYVVEIEEPIPSMVGWLCIDDEIVSQETVHQWGVKITGQPLYNFRAGESCVGEPLLWWSSQAVLEDVLRTLKPAHTFVYFNYGD